MIVICGQNNYKLDTMHVINGVVVESMREGEVDGSSTNNRVAREKCRDLRLRGAVGGLRPPNKNKFFYYF
jgi:hypothetical protein